MKCKYSLATNGWKMNSKLRSFFFQSGVFHFGRKETAEFFLNQFFPEFFQRNQPNNRMEQEDRQIGDIFAARQIFDLFSCCFFCKLLLTKLISDAVWFIRSSVWLFITRTWVKTPKYIIGNNNLKIPLPTPKTIRKDNGGSQSGQSNQPNVFNNGKNFNYYLHIEDIKILEYLNISLSLSFSLALSLIFRQKRKFTFFLPGFARKLFLFAIIFDIIPILKYARKIFRRLLPEC